MTYLSLLISLLAFIISAYTLWLTKIKKGVVEMTRPTVIFFGPDGISNVEKKVFIRTLLYSTSESGQYVQNMFVRLQRGESIQNFNVWVYGDTKLVRGSGLFVDKQGVAYNHHFLLPKDGTSYDFISGEYILQVFIETVNCQPRKIYEQRLSITKSQEDEIVKGNAGVYFDWAPNTQNYHSHIDIGNKKDKELPLFL